MRYLAMGVAGAILSAICLLAISATANAEPVKAAGIARIEAPIVLAQAEQPKKSETVKQKVKRVWRKLTGYEFAVACPALLPINRSTCTETGKDREDARAKCQSRNVFCGVSDKR